MRQVSRWQAGRIEARPACGFLAACGRWRGLIAVASGGAVSAVSGGLLALGADGWRLDLAQPVSGAPRRRPATGDGCGQMRGDDLARLNAMRNKAAEQVFNAERR